MFNISALLTFSSEIRTRFWMWYSVNWIKEFLQTSNNMLKDHFPSTSRLTKEFYQLFWHDIKSPLIFAFLRACQNSELSSSQRQAVIHVAEKKNKIYIQNLRLIFLLNLDTETISKVLTEHCTKREVFHEELLQ